MIVSELIEQLQKYNQDAMVHIVVNCRYQTFLFDYVGDSRSECSQVLLWVEKLR